MSNTTNNLIKLIQETNSVGISYPLNYIKIDFIEKMILDEHLNIVFKESIKKIDKLTNKTLKNIEDYNLCMEIKNIYSEAYIFSKLQSLLSIEKVAEESKKTPDYKIKFNGEDVFIELKSLNMFGGTLKHRDLMAKSLDSKIIAEDEISNGSNIGFGMHEVDPYLSYNREYDPDSVRMVIESLIDKINQNIKEEQYLSGDTVLLIDLSDQLPIFSRPSQSITKEYYEDKGKTYVSGELWHVAFGNRGDKILKLSKFYGADNMDGNLSKEGILINHKYIKAIIFHIYDDFYSLCQLTENNLNIYNLLKYISKRHSSLSQ